ncbi:Extracellular metalloprotease [Beauveria bassiana]|uniref:Extracellular metalloprotease n=1 Tax=Beauveria bassiana TaxID=176275 RepID=A0A2N6N7T5_BEABA|nr:Extracellular metalloprotease [Beauveria bassiana]
MPSLSKMAAATLALTSALLVVDVPGVSAAAIRGVEQTEFCSWRWTRSRRPSTWRGVRTSAFTRGLHRGDRTTLNIYWRNSTKLDYGGTTEIFTVTHDGKRDSMFVNAATIPGGAHPVWNQGKTVVHETGHWFGLDHTPLTDIGDCKWNWKNKPGMNNEYVPAPAQTSML